MLKHYVSVRNLLATSLRSQRGATAVEYGLLVALIAAVIIGIVTFVGKDVSHAFSSVHSGFGGGGGGCVGFGCGP